MGHRGVVHQRVCDHFDIVLGGGLKTKEDAGKESGSIVGVLLKKLIARECPAVISCEGAEVGEIPEIRK